jgi:hypothetical protein
MNPYLYAMIRVKALLFLLLVATPLLLRFGIMTNYLFQYNYYAEVLCENQDKPEMECNGKCALMQELDAAEDGNSNEAPVFPNVKVSEIPAIVPDLFESFYFNQDTESELFKSVFNDLPFMANQVEEQPPTSLLS